MTANSRLNRDGHDDQVVNLFVQGLEFYAFHGVPPEERVVGHRYTLDLDLTVRTNATQTDDVADSVDYGEVSILIANFAQETQFLTVERLAQGMIDVLFSRYPRIEEVRLRLAKRLPPAPIIASAAGIEIFRTRKLAGTS